jgi:dihydroorotase-like cyclic amidohydrolase
MLVKTMRYAVHMHIMHSAHYAQCTPENASLSEGLAAQNVVFVSKAVLSVDRRIFRAAANAERGTGVVIAAHCHRAHLL